MGGEYWLTKTNWNNNGDPCSQALPWYGIGCQTLQNGTTVVQTLNLAVNNITGSIPTSISSLSNLTFLYLNNNLISGNIPDVLYTSFQELQIVVLGTNALTGTISPSISLLNSTLTYFDVQNNLMNGEIPDSVYSLILLTGLFLNGNAQNSNQGFSGTISESIGNLTKLQTLHLDENHFSGTLPSSLYSLTTLTELFVGTNQFQGTISQDIGNLKSMLKLEISNTYMNGTIPESIYNLTSLTYLNLGLNKLNGTISNSIGNLSSLTQLNLQSIDTTSNIFRFSGTIPDSLWELKNLQYLYLSFNLLSGTISPLIGDMKNMIILDLSQNSIQGEIPESLYDLQYLETLFLDQNQLIGTLNGDSFSKLTSLASLLLNSNKLSGTIPTQFFQNYTLSGSGVLSDNPFLCPIPSFAKGHTLGATCEYWVATDVNPQYGSTEGGETITVVGEFQFIPSGLNCSFSNNSIIEGVFSEAQFINYTTIHCITPSFAPSSNIMNFGVTIWYNNTVTSSPLLDPIPFIFETTPVVTSINPSNSMQYGNQSLSISGLNFAATDQFNALFCVFNSTVFAPATFVNTSFITCFSPNLNTTGIIPFSVTNDNGASFSSPNITIQYYEYCQLDDNGNACNGEGTCNNATMPAVCDCNAAYSGENCSTCSPNYYGSSCTACPNCHHGQCDDGNSGSGICICVWEYAGTNCTIPWFYILIAILVIIFIIAIILFSMLIITRRLRMQNQLRQSTFERERLVTSNNLQPTYSANLINERNEEKSLNLDNYEEDADIFNSRQSQSSQKFKELFKENSSPSSPPSSSFENHYEHYSSNEDEENPDICHQGQEEAGDTNSIPADNIAPSPYLSYNDYDD